MNVWLSVVTPIELIRDTFRQSCASGVCWMMMAVTAICVALCMSVSVWGDSELDADRDGEPVMFLPPPSPLGVTSKVAANLRSRVPKVDPDAAKHDGIETLSGRMSLAFGAVSFPVSRARRDAVSFLELVLGWGIAGTFGLLMALVWTAGFLPSFLDPSQHPSCSPSRSRAGNCCWASTSV